MILFHGHQVGAGAYCCKAGGPKAHSRASVSDFRIDLVIAVERPEADVRAAAAKGVGDVPGRVERQDMIASAMSDEHPLLTIETLERGDHPGREGDDRGEQLRVGEAERQSVARAVGEAEQDDVRRDRPRNA